MCIFLKNISVLYVNEILFDCLHHESNGYLNATIYRIDFNKQKKS